jgi:hypothetical protein
MLGLAVVPSVVQRTSRFELRVVKGVVDDAGLAIAVLFELI